MEKHRCLIKTIDMERTYVYIKNLTKYGPIARQEFKDYLGFKLQVTSRRLHKHRFNKSQVNIKLNLQVTARRLHKISLTSLRLSPLADGLHKTIFG